MVSFSTALSGVTVAALAASGSVDAHGTIVKPGLKFTGSGYGGNFAATVPMKGALTPVNGENWFNYPDYTKNAQAFGKALKASQYKTLKDFLMAKQTFDGGRTNMPRTLECGFTDPTSGPVQQLPDKVEWYGGQMNHPGPCEIWCDDEVVLPWNTNCQAAYPDGKFPYQKSKCVGKKRLTMYWMSTLLQWQVYIQCAKIGSGSRSLDFDDLTDTTSYNTTGIDEYDGRAEEEAERAESEEMANIASTYDLTPEENEETGNE